jgi:predicted alpha/beta-fold hydrolase
MAARETLTRAIPMPEKPLSVPLDSIRGQPRPAATRASAHPGSYHAPWWLPGGNTQTIYAALFARVPRQGVRRERWETPDGDFVDVDRVDGPAEAPLVVLFHGLEGGTPSHYARAMLAAVAGRRWRAALPHFRGCGGEPNRLPRAYHSGDSAEIDWMLRRLAGEASAAPCYAMGVSLGGNALLKWLGERGPAARTSVRAAAAVSAPLDLTAAGDALGRGFNMVYTRNFLATLKRKSAAKLERFPRLFDGARVARSRTLREFDDLVTAPLHGFRDAADYWARASSKPWLRAIAVPTLVLNARNDPFLPDEHLPRADEVAPQVALEFPATGGHVGFVNGPFPGRYDWLPRRILAFFEST